MDCTGDDMCLSSIYVPKYLCISILLIDIHVNKTTISRSRYVDMCVCVCVRHERLALHCLTLLGG